ncbi:P-loop NTPase family protein [Raphidiopsis sp. BLCC-F218]
MIFTQIDSPSINPAPSLPNSVTGSLQVFTSSERYFFTNVISQSLRIASHGTPVLIIQFLKGGINQGINNPIQIGNKLDWIRCDLARSPDTPNLNEEEIGSLNSLWEYTQKVVYEGKYSLVVLDELSLAVDFGLIPEKEVLQFLIDRPTHLDMILTGSQMPKSFLDLADQITEIRRLQP